MAFFVLRNPMTPFERNRCFHNSNPYTMENLLANALIDNAFESAAAEPCYYSSARSPFPCSAFGWPKCRRLSHRRRYSPHKLQQRLARSASLAQHPDNNKVAFNELLVPIEGLFRDILAPAYQKQQQKQANVAKDSDKNKTTSASTFEKKENTAPTFDDNKVAFDELMAPIEGLVRGILVPACQQLQAQSNAAKDKKETTASATDDNKIMFDELLTPLESLFRGFLAPNYQKKSEEAKESDKKSNDSNKQEEPMQCTTSCDSQQPAETTTNVVPTVAADSVQSSVVEVAKPKQIEIDVAQFKPENVIVKLVDNRLIVEGQQEQRENGLYTRLELNRQFELGCEFDLNRIQCLYTKQGKLCIQIPRLAKQPDQKSEIVLPIQTESQPMEQDVAQPMDLNDDQDKGTDATAEVAETNVVSAETTEKQPEKQTEENSSEVPFCIIDANKTNMINEDLD